MTETKRYAGADWIANSLRHPRTTAMSPLGVAVANLLGDVFCGIYHLDASELRKVDWGDDYYMVFRLTNSLSTFDNDSLTRLVVLAHDRYLRVTISGDGKGKLELMFHLRTCRTGDIARRMPTMEDHLALIRRYHPAEPEEHP